NGTYDCSAALVIRSANYQEVLPPTGQTEIDIGTPKAGEPLRGTCGMGMYNFVVNFD
ncbi:sulfite exporter TauE/SafE family protein, partial [Candidatus Kaiserbacteria bacterium]|nr:sulfite exporter TauE/SafE family protein [Candidatus Kaiserbacteria bacterium]